jgi:hypothetical protein
VDAALQTDLGGPRPGGFDGTARDFPEIQVVRGTAQIGAAPPLRERAKTAVIQTDVGVIDVAIDHVGHGLSHRGRAQRIRRADHAVKIRSIDAEQSHDVRLG